MTIEKFQQKINKRFPREDLTVLEYKTCKDPCSIKCNKCGDIIYFKYAENSYTKNKQSICYKCFPQEHYDRMTKKDFEERLKIKYPNEKLKVLLFTSTKSPIKIKCLKCGEIREYSNMDHIFSKSSVRVCKRCKRNKIEYAKATADKFKQYINNTPYWILLDDIDNNVPYSNTKIKCKCKFCGKINEKPMNEYIRGNMCSCISKNIPLTNEEFQKEIGDEYTLLSDYQSRNKKVLIRHNKCGFIFSHQARKIKCPHCSGSRMEQETAIFLKQRDINFVKEKSIKINNHKLYFDFFLPELRTFVECQGEQHFRPIKFFGGEEKFLKQQQYDKWKKEWCQEHNFRLIEVYENSSVENQLLTALIKFND